MSKVVCVAVLVKEQGLINKQDNPLGTLQMHMHKSLCIRNMIGALVAGHLHPSLHGCERSIAANALGTGQQLLQLLSETFLSDEGPASQS